MSPAEIGETLRTARVWELLKSLNGDSFCLTGTASVSRATFQVLIYICGGYNHSSIRSDTKFLVVGEGSSLFANSKKLQDARKQGVIVIDESQFCEMIIPTLAELRGDSDVRTKDGQ